jgi:predicted SnoaL-like aldol condensation-catalyzing enzyme
VAEAFDLYGGEGYIQHSPGSPDGRAAVEAALTPYFRDNPLATSEIKRVVAQGDLVVLHVHAKANPVDRGRAVVEIFRVEDGRVVEHWDVIQAVPPNAANENSMF